MKKQQQHIYLLNIKILVQLSDKFIVNYLTETIDDKSLSNSVYRKFFSHIKLPEFNFNKDFANNNFDENYISLQVLKYFIDFFQNRVKINLEKVERGLDPIDYIKNSKSFKNPR